MQQLAGIINESQLNQEEISETRYYPNDKQKWNSMTVDQQNQVIDMINKDLIVGPPLVKFDKKKDYDSLNSDFYDDLHLFLQKLKK